MDWVTIAWLLMDWDMEALDMDMGYMEEITM
jgi:hypothetical protein